MNRTHVQKLFECTLLHTMCYHIFTILSTSMLLCIFLNENLDTRTGIHTRTEINTVVLDDLSKRIRHAVRCDGVVYCTLQLQSCRLLWPNPQNGYARYTDDTCAQCFLCVGLLRVAMIVISPRWKESNRWTSGFVSVSQYYVRIGIIAVAPRLEKCTTR